MKKLLNIIALIAFLLLPSCTKDSTEGRFNVVPWEQPEITTPTTTTTTTTLPSSNNRWEIRQPKKPTPFETDVPTRKPWGCDEGEERGVDC